MMNLPSLILLALAALSSGEAMSGMELVRVAPNEKGFVLARSDKPFIPWGHNYAVNEPDPPAPVDWTRVARDFDDFHRMGAM